jgi:glycosyltransferase involved in cell wall biosynthesis
MKASAGKRVLMLLENYPFPQDARVRAEAQALSEAGYRVAVIAPSGRGQRSNELVDGVRVYRYRSPVNANGYFGYLAEYGYSTLASLFLSVRALLSGGFDIVHAHNPPDTLVFIGGLYKLFGKRFLYDHHDLAPEMYDARFDGKGPRLLRRALLLLEKLSCSVADHVIATNESYKATEIERHSLPSDKVTIVRNGPILDRLQPVDPDPELRARAGTIVGYVGVMGYTDGVDHLLRALHHLVYDLGRTNTLGVLIGQGDAWKELQLLATSLGLDDHVWFTGFIPDGDMIRYVCTADVCVDPDPSNPFNDRSTMVKMMEYMALGRPIVSFDLPEHRVTAGRAAAYVRPNDELEFARTIAELMDDPERRAEMSAFGRRRVEEKLAWRHSIPHLLEAYDKVLNGSKARAA